MLELKDFKSKNRVVEFLLSCLTYNQINHGKFLEKFFSKVVLPGFRFFRKPCNKDYGILDVSRKDLRLGS